MRPFLTALTSLVCSISAAQTAPLPAASTVKTAQGTTLPLVIVRPLLRKRAAVHDAVYA